MSGLVAAAISGEAEARKQVSESLRLAAKITDAWVPAAALAVLGWPRVALEEHEGDDAVFTQTLTVARAVGAARLAAIVHDSLDPQTPDRCWSDGRSMRFNEAVAAALPSLRTVETEPTPFPRPPHRRLADESAERILSRSIR